MNEKKKILGNLNNDQHSAFYYYIFIAYENVLDMCRI